MPGSIDHLLHRGALVALTDTILKLAGSQDPAREGRSKRARFHYEDFYTKGLDLLGKGLMYGFNGKFTGGIGSSTRTGYEAVHIEGFVRQILERYLKKKK